MVEGSGESNTPWALAERGRRENKKDKNLPTGRRWFTYYIDTTGIMRAAE